MEREINAMKPVKQWLCEACDGAMNHPEREIEDGAVLRDAHDIKTSCMGLLCEHCGILVLVQDELVEKALGMKLPTLKQKILHHSP